jgi:flagellar hook-length control protein FliK
MTASGHAKTAKDGAAESSTSAAPASLSDAFKPADAPQQQNPTAIDFSALVHARAGKPEALATAPGLDSAAAAQLQLASNHLGSADGQPTPLHVVPVEIGLRALAGSKRFDIRLDPAELGRIDVKLEISDKGEVSAKLVVDRVETLHLLQRDARTLERAFEQAGLKPSDAGVDITLRDQNDQSSFRQNRQDEQAPRRARSASEAEIDDIAIAAQPTPVRRLIRLGGVDLSI